MSRSNKIKTYGLIGLLLIAIAFMVWGFVIPELRKSAGDKTIHTVTKTPIQQQQNPSLPTGESAMPRP